ncbi:sugar ABC transporter permease [Frondihabitans sucicola]|uniref:Sugar ABC transporter permease n=1 Tax=Frondihabitans sucicola TaxID=1268041 RepID=A0ABM8GMI4_9MICO|nr:sugar ABC transporter permease [Frondihabitans sucicola]BDZ49606.1 sugar ABC transporter permease [Frondihabitans sucicola]
MTSTDTPATTRSGVSGPPVRRRRKKFSFDRVSFFVVFLGIPVVGYLIFVIWPFLQAFYYSLTDWSGFSPDMNFIGLKNYVNLFQDSIFLKAVGNSVTLLIVLPFVTLVIAMAFASIIVLGGPSNGPIRGLKASSLYRVVSFFPYVIPAIVIAIIWSFVYDPSAGLLNGILQSLGGNWANSFAWLGNPRTALVSVIFVIVWGLVGFYMVLFIASIKGVPAEIYEAARIDGAGRFRTAISITVPLIRDNIQTAYIYMGILALDAFVYMAGLEAGGGPGNSTLVISQRLFTTAFTKGQFGYASAMGVTLALITLLFAAVVFAVNRLTGGTNEVSE